jgi:oxygen-independent coproporphyrinogen-3 oxidase
MVREHHSRRKRSVLRAQLLNKTATQNEPAEVDGVLHLLNARVPRYTSYPTAPHFHAGITNEMYRDWLAQAEPGAPLSLYVHVPFCDTLCWFCGCHTTVVNGYSPVGSYLDYLLRELDLIGGIVSGRVTHIHWGGGSPTILRPDDVRRLASEIRNRVEVAPDAEFAVEIDPRGFDAAMAQALAHAGITRASIGVQDYDPIVQRAINRIQGPEVTADAVRALRRHGINRLNVDLIYGLPHQTSRGLGETIEAVLRLEPDRLAVFGYAHVPHFKKHQNLIPLDALPGPVERLEQADLAHALLTARGYVPIGIDHYAKPDDSLAIAQGERRLARNFQGYTADTAPALIGIGASSIGALPQGYVQNIADVPSYRAALKERRLPIARGIALSADDRMRRDVIGRLMCDLEADLVSISTAHGFADDYLDAEIRALEPLATAGIVDIDRRRISVATKWRTLTRVVCAAFDRHLRSTTKQHAQAV